MICCIEIEDVTDLDSLYLTDFVPGYSCIML
ncbi:hypothetical protein M6B38_292750 [Iris pallida]|uniref:Uncharacterized protein n=1 Tax=Iris pallida TaxID=29817 RepID=A0AAX6HTU7_IRIPA|nr:hypothetical protein M6B38_344100 [Iris pallida]KAJ6844470.1 hypothetical protein M6B38_292750 [Iris pallida]